jgi:perosamine synthetase
MNLLQRTRQVFRHQAGMCARVVRGLPPELTPLGSGTLDSDDVEIAREWLRRPSGGDGRAELERFEAEFARWNGSESSFAFMGGREALSAGLDALQLAPGDEVIIPGYTCVVVPNAVEFAGLVPVYADIELDTYGIDAASLEPCITPRTRAVVIQHLYGLVSRDYLAIVDLAARRGLRVIEDCAQATGASLAGIKVGNRGDLAFYSSEQSKVFSTFQGGVAVSRDPELAARLARYRDRVPAPDAGRVQRVLLNLIVNYERFKAPSRWWRGDRAWLRHGGDRIETTSAGEMEGRRPADYGRRMAAPLAAIASNQLRKLDWYNARRREHASRWDAWCRSHDLAPATVVAGSTPVFLRYPVLASAAMKHNRSWARRQLGVELGVWFVTHAHPAARPVSGCPNATIAVERCINFPTLFGDAFGAHS